MTSGVRLLAVWLTPVLWLGMPALILDRGPEGLGIAFALTLAPLIALAARSAEPALGGSEPLFPVVVLLFTVAVLLWANMILAGDVAVWLDAPRWQGVVLTAGGGVIPAGWRGGGPLAAGALLPPPPS